MWIKVCNINSLGKGREFALDLDSLVLSRFVNMRQIMERTEALNKSICLCNNRNRICYWTFDDNIIGLKNNVPISSGIICCE